MQIGSTLTPFSHTMAVLIACVFFWNVLNYALKYWDPLWDAPDSELEISQIKNELLLEQLNRSNELLIGLSNNLEALLANNSALEKHKDRLVELGFEIEKVGMKTNRNLVDPINAQQSHKEQDLFTPIKVGKSRRPPRSRTRKLPKF